VNSNGIKTRSDLGVLAVILIISMTAASANIKNRKPKTPVRISAVSEVRRKNGNNRIAEPKTVKRIK
jgi:hypothetical protein